VFYGGILTSAGSALRIGGRDVLITEACEYHNSFLHFNPTAGIILNIEMDHSDFFADIRALYASFQNFAKKIPPEGLLVINKQTDDLKEFLKAAGCEVSTFGEEGGLCADNMRFNSSGHGRFDVYLDGEVLGKIDMSVPGQHNIQNALAAIACALRHDVDFDTIAQALADFTGVERRFQKIGQFSGAKVIDDYAHHPTEISATLLAAKHIYHHRLWAVFQPHTHARTKRLLKDFAESLADADEVVVLDIYSPAGREDNAHNVHSKDIIAEMRKLGINAYYAPDFDTAAELLAAHVLPEDIIITMGAGDVGNLAKKLCQGR